ncbi:MAG: DoxX family protein [Verrucomicrobiota bacterium]
MSQITIPSTLSRIDGPYDLLVAIGNHLQSPVLYVLRFIFGIQLMEAGVGKLLHIQTPIDYFTQLGIPLPVANAWLVAGTETFGGIFLALGLAMRVMALPLTINFVVAYLTTEMDSLHKLADLSSFPDLKTDAFFGAAPFPFLGLAILMLAFGPGAYSVDYLIARWRRRPWRGPGV